MTVFSTSSLSVVSCNANKLAYSKIYLVTDTGKISDKGFNEAGYNGGNAFLQNVVSASNENTKYKKSKVSYIEPTSLPQIPEGYSIAAKFGAKVIIMTGFRHQNYLFDATTTMGPDGTAVMMDGGCNTYTGKYNNQTIGLRYQRDIPGFYAGMAAIIWYFQNHKNQSSLTMGAFGGIQSALSVDSYLAGYFAAMEAFNRLFHTNSSFKDEFFKDDSRNLVVKGTQSQWSNGQIQSPVSNSDAKWFTGSFSTGDGIPINQALIDGGAQIIFPVAGQETNDTIGQIRQKNMQGKVYVVGVDTDQVQSFKQDSDLFITSGTIKLVGSVADAISHSKYFSKYFKDNVCNNNMINGLHTLLKNQGIDNTNLTYDDGKTGSPVDDETQANLEKDGSDWSGKQIWFGGDFAFGNGQKGDNKVTKDLHDEIETYFSSSHFDLDAASKNYFKYIQSGGENGDATHTLSKSTIKTWVDALLKSETIFKEEIQ